MATTEHILADRLFFSNGWLLLMIKRIHILGASGAGTTTLGKALSKRLGCAHFDTDDYFWLPTDPPFQHKRPVEERRQLLASDLSRGEKWILTGSLCGWGDFFIDRFDLAVYLWVPADIRIRRLIRRETSRFGQARISPGGDMFENHRDFIDWASRYDAGGLNMRSRASHEEWLARLPCPVVRIEGKIDLDKSIDMISRVLTRRLCL